MKTPKPHPDDPDPVRFVNALEDRWEFALRLTEADVRLLSGGIVPEWLQQTAEWWCSDHPVGAVPPGFKTYAHDAAQAERRSA